MRSHTTKGSDYDGRTRRKILEIYVSCAPIRLKSEVRRAVEIGNVMIQRAPTSKAKGKFCCNKSPGARSPLATKAQRVHRSSLPPTKTGAANSVARLMKL
jgi:hypothetical protein